MVLTPHRGRASRQEVVRQTILLDELLEQENDPLKTIKLTKLKSIEQSEKAGKIRSSISTFQTEIKPRFHALLPIIEALNFSPEIWRSYATWVMTARSYQLKRFGNLVQLRFDASLWWRKNR